MSTTPYGCISEPLQILATMLSNSPAFQLWVEEHDVLIPDTPDERAAFCLNYIHYPAYKGDASTFVYPAAIIEVPEDVDFETIAQSYDGATFNTGSGTLDLTIYRVVPEALRNDLNGAWLDFAGVDVDGVKMGLGAILRDLMELGVTTEQFESFKIGLVAGPAFVSEGKRAALGHLIGATLRFHWGVP